MASTSEAGHAKNVANFDKLISTVKSYGATYNPTKASIKTTALDTLATAARTSLDTVNTTTRAFQKATADRQVVFAPIKKLCTQIVNGLYATDACKQVKEDASAINKKIQGTTTSAATLAKAVAKAAEMGAPTPKTVSTSQQSFDNLIEHFAKLIVLLQSEPLYVPNEATIKVTALTTLLASMRAANKAVNDAEPPKDKARIARDKLLYADETGLCDVALAVKSYLISVYTASSPEYKVVKSISFKRIES
jgi:hypothetical protein